MSNVEIIITSEVFSEGYQFFVNDDKIQNDKSQVIIPTFSFTYPLILSPKGTSDFFIDSSYTIFTDRINKFKEKIKYDNDIYSKTETICNSARKIGFPSIYIKKIVEKKIHIEYGGYFLILDLDKSKIKVSFPHKKIIHREHGEITSISILFDSEKVKESYIYSPDNLLKRIRKII